MTEYLEFLSAYDPSPSVSSPRCPATPERLCCCCLSKDRILVNLVNCKHNSFLRKYYSFDNPMAFVCNTCHTMLKKIQMFKNQIEESCRILKRQVIDKRKRYKLYNQLQRSTTTKCSINCDIKKTGVLIKKEAENQGLEVQDSKVEINLPPKCEPQYQTVEVKIEHELSDFETDLPLTKIQKKKKTQRGLVLEEVASLDEKYDGKIRYIILSREGLMEEREKEAKKESYLKQPHKCVTCIKGFDHELTLKSHCEKQHKREGMYRCEVCDSMLGNENTFRDHLRRHVERFECMICGKRTTELLSVTEHYNQQHAASGTIQMEFTCIYCPFTTDSLTKQRHHRKQHKEKPTCTICQNTFSSAYVLKVHMNTVHVEGLRPYKCKICDKAYKCKSGVLNHTTNAHGNPQTAYCDKCGTQYKTVNGLQNHLKTHSAHITEESKRYICHECNARFINKTLLRIHIEWEHLKKVQFECNNCPKVFKTAGTLKKHQNAVHEKKRPPKDKICDHCGRAFAANTTLVAHLRTHTGERPFKCSTCSATFGHKGALYTHNKLKHKKLKQNKS